MSEVSLVTDQSNLYIADRRLTGDCSRRSPSAVSVVEEQFSFLLFSFSTGFLIYSTCILYKMWTNCGKKTSSIRKKLAQQMYDCWIPNESKKRLFPCNFKICEVILGFGVGFLAVFSCAGTIVIDKVLTNTEASGQSVQLFYHVVVSVIWLAVMGFTLPLATCIIKGHPKRPTGVINWMSEPVLAVTSLAALTYAVFNAMAALLQLIKDSERETIMQSIGDEWKVEVAEYGQVDKLQAEAEAKIVATFVFVLNVFRIAEIVLQSIYLSDATRRQVSTSTASNNGGDDNGSCDDEDDLSWAERTSSSRVFVLLFMLVNVALSISEFYELTHSLVINAEQVHFLGTIKWCLFTYVVGVFVCLYRMHSVICLLDVLRIAF